jgi:hemerythrin-like metal-binding protein
MLIQWSDDLSVNVKGLDIQHKRLVNNLNELYDAINAGEGSEILDDVLQALLDYTYYHFASEETLMNKHDYPEYDNHKKEHDDLKKQVLSLIKKYEEDESISMPLKALQFLKNWLYNHILETDKQYSSFLNEKGVN